MRLIGVMLSVLFCVACLARGQDLATMSADARLLDKVVTDYIVNAEQRDFPGYFFRLETEDIREDIESDFYRVVGFRVSTDATHDRFEYEGRRDFVPLLTHSFVFGRLKIENRIWERNDIRRPGEIFEVTEPDSRKLKFDWNPFDCVFYEPITLIEPTYKDVLPRLFVEGQVIDLTKTEKGLTVTWQRKKYSYTKTFFSAEHGYMPTFFGVFTAKVDQATNELSIGKLICANVIEWKQHDKTWLPTKITSDSQYPKSSSKFELCWIPAAKIKKDLFSTDDFRWSTTNVGLRLELDDAINTLEPSTIFEDVLDKKERQRK